MASSRVHGHTRGHGVPADSGHGYDFLPVAGSGCGCGYEVLLADSGIQRCYPRGFYPLPSLGRSSSISQRIEYDRIASPTAREGSETLEPGPVKSCLFLGVVRSPV